MMFCCSAAGVIMPPFLVYPRPKPVRCNPLNGALPGTVIEYSKKGWMDAVTFLRFIDHFDQHAGTKRPVLLILDSVSSHVDMAAFSRAAEKGIELYRLVPNATHLMQPLDKGVFGTLKTKWHQATRCHTRDFPGSKLCREAGRGVQRLLSATDCHQQFQGNWSLPRGSEPDHSRYACAGADIRGSGSHREC